MHHRFTVAFLGLAFAAFFGCVEVPDNIRANFAAPAPVERTNYRPGNHGSARPLVDPTPKMAVNPGANEADAGVAATTTTTSASPANENEAKDGGGQ